MLTPVFLYRYRKMETHDVVDKFGARTGRVIPRGTELTAGEFYLVAHVWIQDENDNFLIQRRAFHLTSSPGVWATTVGYILAGEDSLAGAIREVQEELGIQLSPDQLRQFRRHTMGNHVEDIWLAKVVGNVIGVPGLGPDVADWKWISKVELEQMVNCGDFFRYSYLDEILTCQWR